MGTRAIISSGLLRFVYSENNTIKNNGYNKRGGASYGQVGERRSSLFTSDILSSFSIWMLLLNCHIEAACLPFLVHFIISIFLSSINTKSKFRGAWVSLPEPLFTDESRR